MRKLPLVTAIGALVFAPCALASFHLMQIEQVVGGLGGDTTQQAIQLRLRNQFQNLVQQARLVVRDAAGQNPIVLIDLNSAVAVSAVGARILIVSPAFAAAQNPSEDFVMTMTIPASYLAAGRLTFENDFGTIYWSLAWGGANYTGPNTGAPDNDSNSNFGPPFANPLPSGTGQALQFPGVAGALSTSNNADYAVTLGDATFTNNAGQSGVVVPPIPPEVPILRDGFEDPP